MNRYFISNITKIFCPLQPLMAVSAILIYSLFFINCAFALSPPATQQFISPYIASKAPVISSIASSAKPIAVGDAANEGALMNLQIRTDTFTAPMDAYLLFLIPSLTGDSLLLIDEYGNIQFLESGLTPWKRGVTNLNEQPLGEIPTDMLPGDTYTFYLLLMEPDSSNYYLWAATMNLKPTILQFAEAVINKFPTEVDAPLAVLLSFEMGYSLEQIVNGAMKGIINSDGVINDSSGSLVIPENESLGLIVDNRRVKSSISRIDNRYFTKEELEKSIKWYEKSLMSSDGLTDKDVLAMIISIFCNYVIVNRDEDDEKIIHPADRLYYFFRLYAIAREFRVPDTAADRTAFLQDSNNFIELYDGSPEDSNSAPLPANSSIHETFRNRPPTARDSSVIAIKERTTSVILYAEDPDVEDVLKYEVLLEPENGTLSGSGEFLNYKSNKGFTGTDSFTFRVSDGKRYSDEATVEIEVKAGVLILDKVVLSKYNGASGDKCADSTPESREVCGEFFKLASGTELYNTYTLNSNKATYNFQEIYVGLENKYDDLKSDYQVTFTFDSPPETVTPGETLSLLRIEGTAQGYITGGYINRGFVYYIVNTNSSSASYFEDTDIYLLNRDLPYNEEHGRFEGSITDFNYTDITIPSTAGDGFKIGGKFGWDPGYYIEWIYRLEVR